MTYDTTPSPFVRLLRRSLTALLLAAVVLLLAAHTGNAQEAPPSADPAANSVADPALPAAPVGPDAVTGTTVDRDITQNTTWTKAGSPYNVTRNVDVVAGVTLTIEPGVTVVVGNQEGFAIPMSVNGTLIAQGTAAQPITFTGIKPEVGSWGGLIVGNSETEPAKVTLNYVIMEYGAMLNSHNRGNLELQSAIADIDNSTFRNGGSYGISATYATQLKLRNSSFVNNNFSPLLFSFGSPKFDPQLSNLTASGNKAFNAVVYESISIDKPHTFEKMGLPYVFKGGFDIEPSGHAIFNPGVEIRVDTGFYVDGMMTAVGTPAEPILFTGIKQQPGGWWGINVSGGQLGIAGLRLDHAIVEYGGPDGGEDYGGNLIVSTANVTVTNTTLRNSSTYGVYNEGGAPDETYAVSIANSTISNNQKGAVVCTDESCNMTLTNLTVNGNGKDGIIYRAYVSGTATWRNMGMPYFIEGQGGVMDDSSLTIEPGVEIRMAEEASFSVNGVLSAVGTPAQPVVFRGLTNQPGAWQGIRIDNGGVAELRYCDIGYGGNWGPVDTSGQLMTQSSSLSLSNCRIHDSSSGGIVVVAGAKPNIRNNSIVNNKYGLIAVFPLEQVDARFNWWGHASGPKHTSNPNGQGQEVLGDVALDPWLTSPDDTGGGPAGITVDLSGPGRYAPGQTVIYSVFYYNGTGKPIDNAVLRFGMPANAVLLDASPSAVFHADRNHVFWKLGNLAHAGQGLLWVRVRYDWGLPQGMKTATAAQLSGTNLASPVFNVQDYLSYVPRTLQTVVDLSSAQVDTLRGAAPELNKLYQQAIADGFVFGNAEEHTYSSGGKETEIRLLRFTPSFHYFSIYYANGNTVGILVDGSSYTVVRDGDAVRYDVQSNAWAPVNLGLLQTAATHDGISWGDCVQNCIEDKLPGYIIKKKIKSISELSKISSCVKSAAGDDGSYLGCAKYIGKVVPGVGEGIDLGLCNGECEQCEESGGSCDNPNCHCCTEDKYRCDAGDWLYGSFGIDVIKMKKCSLDEGDDMGKYLAETVIKVCALCEKCMDSGSPVCVGKFSTNQTLDAMATVFTLAAQQGAQDKLEVAASSDEECDECRQAKDPNEMYGPAGDLLPGQLVTYEVAYENIGEGTAFGVFIMNRIPDNVFDLSTLQINNGGSYSAGAKSISWDLGDLAPKGQPGATGKVSYSVRLRSDLPSGTVIANSAVVHFPSVPEETPTNRLVNLIAPLVATPQSLQTEALKPIAFTLGGRDAAGAPVTFTVLEAPLYGTLKGTAPNLTYTPDAGASGLDRIRFVVGNGVATSAPADINIRILPSSTDVTGPTVKWTAPRHQAQVTLAAAVAGQDSTGAYYYPVVQAQFNEAVNPKTINSQTVIVTDQAGKVVKADVRYDAAIDQINLLFREEPKVGKAYAVTLTTGVKDLRGNPLAAHYSWSFTIAAIGQPAEQPTIYLPVVKR